MHESHDAFITCEQILAGALTLISQLQNETLLGVSPNQELHKNKDLDAEDARHKNNGFKSEEPVEGEKVVLGIRKASIFAREADHRRRCTYELSARHCSSCW